MPKTKLRGLQTLTAELVLTVLLIAAGAAILGFGIMYATNAKYHADLAYRHAAITAYASLDGSQFTVVFKGLGNAQVESVKVGYWHKDNTESDVVDVNCPPVRQIRLNSYASFAGHSGMDQYAGTVGYGYELRCNVGIGPKGPYNLTYVVVRDGDAVKVFRWRFVSVTPSGEVERQLAEQLRNQAQQLQQRLGQQYQLLASQLQQIQEQAIRQLAQYGQQLQQQIAQQLQQQAQHVVADFVGRTDYVFFTDDGSSNGGGNNGNTGGTTTSGVTSTRTYTDVIDVWMPDPRSTTTGVIRGSTQTTWPRTTRYTSIPTTTTTTSTPPPPSSTQTPNGLTTPTSTQTLSPTSSGEGSGQTTYTATTYAQYTNPANAQQNQATQITATSTNPNAAYWAAWSAAYGSAASMAAGGNGNTGTYTTTGTALIIGLAAEGQDIFGLNVPKGTVSQVGQYLGINPNDKVTVTVTSTNTVNVKNLGAISQYGYGYPGSNTQAVHGGVTVSSSSGSTSGSRSSGDSSDRGGGSSRSSSSGDSSSKSSSSSGSSSSSDRSSGSSSSSSSSSGGSGSTSNAGSSSYAEPDQNYTPSTNVGKLSPKAKNANYAS